MSVNTDLHKQRQLTITMSVLSGFSVIIECKTEVANSVRRDALLST